MTEPFREQILENMEAIAKLGLRCLALASRRYDEPYEEGQEVDRHVIENDLVFRGLVGLYDPPRPESAPSLFLAWEVIDMRLSFFMMQPGSKKYFTQWAIDIWSNRFLFGAVVFGFVTIFPLIYIPRQVWR